MKSDTELAKAFRALREAVIEAEPQDRKELETTLDLNLQNTAETGARIAFYRSSIEDLERELRHKEGEIEEMKCTVSELQEKVAGLEMEVQEICDLRAQVKQLEEEKEDLEEAVYQAEREGRLCR